MTAAHLFMLAIALAIVVFYLTTASNDLETFLGSAGPKSTGKGVGGPAQNKQDTFHS